MARTVRIPIANKQTLLQLDLERIRLVLQKLLTSAGYYKGEISLAIVDNATIHELNRNYLQHNYPTDVISFPFHKASPRIAGEVIASAEYAIAEAQRYDWPAENELLLYLVHGTLHCLGYDDTTPAAATIMRAQERAVLAEFGLNPPGRD